MPDRENPNDPSQSLISEEEFAAAQSPPDLKGRINLRLEQMLQQEIEDIAEDSRYPLKSVSEVVRFCCLIGIERLRDWKPQPTLIGAIKAANALATRDKIQSDAMDLIQRLDERINWYINERAFEEAVSLVAQVRSYFEVLPDDGFWRRHIIEQIDAKFMQWQTSIDKAQED